MALTKNGPATFSSPFIDESVVQIAELAEIIGATPVELILRYADLSHSILAYNTMLVVTEDEMSKLHKDFIVATLNSNQDMSKTMYVTNTWAEQVLRTHEAGFHHVQGNVVTIAQNEKLKDEWCAVYRAPEGQNRFWVAVGYAA